MDLLFWNAKKCYTHCWQDACNSVYIYGGTVALVDDAKLLYLVKDKKDTIHQCQGKQVLQVFEELLAASCRTAKYR